MLNSGSAMFFTFIKMCIVYLLLRFLLTDGFNVITNFMATFCSRDDVDLCGKNSFAKSSLYNKMTPTSEKLIVIVDILNLATVVVSILFFFFYRKYQYGIYSLLDSNAHTQDDYTLFVENIPVFMAVETTQSGKISFEYEAGLKKIFEDRIEEWLYMLKADLNQPEVIEGLPALEKEMIKLMQKTPNFDSIPKVRSVSLCFDLTEMEKINKRRDILMTEFIKKIEEDENFQFNVDSKYYIPNQIDILNEEFVQLSKRFAMDNSSAFNLSHFVGKAFVSLEYSHYKEYLLRDCRYSNKLLVEERDTELEISQAATPSDIFWYNMQIDDEERRQKVIYSFVILVMALGFSFAILLAVNVVQLQRTQTVGGKEQTELKDLVVSYIFTIAMAIITNVVNFILSAVIYYLTDGERHKTKSDHTTSLIVKIVVSQFINTAIIYYILARTHPEVEVLSENGLVVKVMSLVAVSGLVQIGMNIAQPGALISFVLNKCKYSRDKEINMFQVQLNKQLESSPFDFSERYAYYLVNIFVVSFYAYITPLATPITAAIFLVQYWVDKFNLFRRFSCPVNFNYRLSRFIITIFECSVFLFALGNFIFAPEVHSEEYLKWSAVNWITIAIALAYVLAVLLLPKKWEDKIFNFGELENMPYSTCIKQGLFNKVYWLSNPGTNFAKEQDINNNKQYINYGDDIGLATIGDFLNFRHEDEEGHHHFEVYDKNDEQRMIAQMFLSQNPQEGGQPNQGGGNLLAGLLQPQEGQK